MILSSSNVRMVGKLLSQFILKHKKELCFQSNVHNDEFFKWEIWPYFIEIARKCSFDILC